jgi:acetoin utilization protein AcuC
MAVAVLYRDELKEYDFGPGHSFRGDRFQIFRDFLREHLPEDDNYWIIEADWATDEDLLLICGQEYITYTQGYYRAANLGLRYPGQFYQFHSGDNAVLSKPGKLEEAARLIVGQAKRACDLVMAGESTKAVSVGGGLHHAKPSYGEGFCLYNDVAFCGRYLTQVHGLERVLILDTDAHGGNGTSEYFYSDPAVLLIDLHQDPSYLYPGTGFADQIGSGSGKGFTVNVPLPMYAGIDSYRLVFEEIVQPIVGEFQPQIVVRNGGSDPHFSDGLTNLGLSVAGFRMIGELTRWTAEICGGKAVDLITSGYNQEVLPHAWLALIGGLAGWDVPTDEPQPVPQRFRTDPSLSATRTVIEDVKRHQKEYWHSLR